MGWGGGTSLFWAIAPSLKDVEIQKRTQIYTALIKWAESKDWDTQDEAEGIDPVLDELLGLDGDD